MGMFDNAYMNLGEQLLDATWYKMQVINNNIANNDTENFKAKSVDFRIALEKEKCKCKYHVKTEDQKDEKNDKIELDVITSSQPETVQTLNGNNVDMEKETMAFADAQYQYSTMIDYMNSQYAMMRTALSRN